MSHILPKKKWHVGRPENRERVRQDKEQAQIAQEHCEARVQLAEREVRLQLLRAKKFSGHQPNSITTAMQSGSKSMAATKNLLFSAAIPALEPLKAKEEAEMRYIQRRAHDVPLKAALPDKNSATPWYLQHDQQRLPSLSNGLSKQKRPMFCSSISKKLVNTKATRVGLRPSDKDKQILDAQHSKLDPMTRH